MAAAATKSKTQKLHHTSEFRRFSYISPKHTNNSNNNNVRITNNDTIKQENDALKLPKITTVRNEEKLAKNPTKAEDVRLPKIPAKTDIPINRYIRRPIQKPGRRDIPVSIETEHRHIVTTANQCIMELRAFKRGYRTEGFDFVKCKDTAVDIVNMINLEEGEIERADEFRKLLATRKLGTRLFIYCFLFFFF